jgi:hypothetical protein
VIAMPGRRARRIALLLAALLATQLGCATRTARDVITDDGYNQVILRQEKRVTTVIDQNYDHPVAIAPVRLAHILSRIDMRSGAEGERVAAIPLETLFKIAELMAQGLSEADSSQEVAIQSIRRDRHWKVFERQYLTSLVCYVQSDVLYINVGRSDWEIPDRRKKQAGRGVALPEAHFGEQRLKFRLVVDHGMTLMGEQTVAVDWRNDVFRKPTRTRVTPTGKVVRRTVLMESYEDETDYGDVPQISDDITAEQFRALADLEEQRRSGAVTEAEYYARKRSILMGEEPAP